MIVKVIANRSTVIAEQSWDWRGAIQGTVGGMLRAAIRKQAPRLLVGLIHHHGALRDVAIMAAQADGDAGDDWRRGAVPLGWSAEVYRVAEAASVIATADLQRFLGDQRYVLSPEVVIAFISALARDAAAGDQIATVAASATMGSMAACAAASAIVVRTQHVVVGDKCLCRRHAHKTYSKQSEEDY